MRFLILLLAFCMVAVLGYAGVTAEILDITQDQSNGSIIVKTQYKLDGVEVISRYPKDEQGRSYWVTRYNIDKFAVMSDQQAKTYILNDLKQFAQSVIRQAYFKIANFDYTQEKADLLIGATGEVNTADILVDTNADGIADTIWYVKSDGTKTEEPYEP